MGKLAEFDFNKENKNTKNVTEEELRNKFDEYKDMSKEELNSQLFSEVARQKAMGTFDYDKLASLVESLKGSLPEQDFYNIIRILESLR